MSTIFRLLSLSLLFLMTGGSAIIAYADDPSPAVKIGSRREIFVDRHLIGSLEGAALTLSRPRDMGIVIPFDNPWEGEFCGYSTVLKDGDTFRMYYRGLPKAGLTKNGLQLYCYAESKDGHDWKKPNLGLFEVSGSKENNVVFFDPNESLNHNFCPMIDTRPGVPASERYKALSGSRRTGLVAFVSADGIHWKKLREQAVIPKGAFDSQNVPLWSAHEGRYICYFRVGVNGIRRISRTTSKDFLNWTEPVLMEYDNGLIEHLYTNQTSPYFRAPHIYIGIAARFFPGRRVLNSQQAKEIGVDPKYFNDCSDAVLITTRGGNQYSRTFPEGFVRPGIGLQNWVSRTNYPALNVVQTAKDKMSFYVNQNYGQPTAHLRRYELRLDGFASVRAPYSGGNMVTKPLTFSGKHLDLNFATSAAGSIRVEIQDAAGKPIPGFSLEEANDLIGNEISRVASWKSGSDVSTLAGKSVRLRFVMKDADLYAFQFSE